MEINWIQLIGQIINVLILVWLLNKFLYKPLLKLIKDRNKRIKEGLELAKANEEARQKIKKLEEERLAAAEKKVLELIQKAKREANQEAKEIIHQAQLKAKEEMEKQRRLLLEELKEERAKIKEEASDLVVKVSEKVLSDLLDKTTQEKIIKNALSKLEKMRFAANE